MEPTVLSAPREYIKQPHGDKSIDLYIMFILKIYIYIHVYIQINHPNNKYDIKYLYKIFV